MAGVGGSLGYLVFGIIIFFFFFFVWLLTHCFSGGRLEQLVRYWLVFVV